jgi:hypothetical protein
MTACSFAHGVSGDASMPDVPDSPTDAAIDGSSRVVSGLVALYTFDERAGDVVTDTAGVGAPVNLTIADTTKVTWLPGQLAINAPVIIASQASVPNRINVACKATNAMTLEAWVIPALADQNGASGQFARVVTMSLNAGSRNFALGQQGTQWAIQARTTNASVDGQGSPILVGGTVALTPTNLVLTVGGTGRALYVNGMLVSSDALGGSLANWLDGYRLGMAAEPSQNNPWRGTMLLVAIYDRVLAPPEIMTNFLAGPDAR